MGSAGPLTHQLDQILIEKCPDVCLAPSPQPQGSLLPGPLFLWWLLPPALQTACSHDFVTAPVSQRLRLWSRNTKQYYTTRYFRGNFFFFF